MPNPIKGLTNFVRSASARPKVLPLPISKTPVGMLAAGHKVGQYKPTGPATPNLAALKARIASKTKPARGGGARASLGFGIPEHSSGYGQSGGTFTGSAGSQEPSAAELSRRVREMDGPRKQSPADKARLAKEKEQAFKREMADEAKARKKRR